MPSLDTVPLELLEHIAFLAAIHPLLGPPSALHSLLVVNRSVHAALALDRNPLLYARICAAKFDLAAPARRLGFSALRAPILAAELVKRCRVLKRLRALDGARLTSPSPYYDDAREHRSTNTSANESESIDTIDELLSTAYLMVLEDEGRNAAQLRSYAHADKWLCVYWFDDVGASGAMRSLQQDRWPVPGLGAVNGVYAARGAHVNHALAMWLLWFFFEPVVYVSDPDLFRRADHLLKLIALNAPVYPLTRLPWTSFNPGPSHIHFGTPTTRSDEPVSARLPSLNNLPSTSAKAIASSTNLTRSHLTHFATPLPRLLPPPGAAPAILAYLSLAARARRDAHDSSIFGIVGGVAPHYAPLSPGGLSALGGGDFGFGLGGIGNGIGADTMWSDILGLGGLDLSMGTGTGTGTGGMMGGGDAFVAFPELGMSPAERAQMMMGGPGAISQRWECDWRRSVGMGGGPLARPTLAFKPGSIDGAWEGTFTYTEFHSFAALLEGCAPNKLRDCVLAQHNQTWRIREHHLATCSSSHASPTPPPSSLSTAESTGIPTVDPSPLPVGDPICAHIPDGASISESSEGLTITVASLAGGLQPAVYTYQRYSPTRARAFNLSETSSIDTSVSVSGGSNDGERGIVNVKGKESDARDGDGDGDEYRSAGSRYAAHVRDIILTGEGHSGWGEFRIVGRVRPSDGFVSAMKEYTSGDRGRWLYRGYLIGGSAGSVNSVCGGSSSQVHLPSESTEKGDDIDDEIEGAGTGEGGYIVGRWRDTLTPGETHGYEGAFALARRR
ncbi:hypothetical protein EW145_g3269 [Phellinidium pouzarii]|uniref:F-box domain-containing protein n=1 Tax=Phellinidium pouzarii TaxID=167371 RepID=A0A4S4L7N4_9AGAM|nr:hypothetical protein EW145_g3269 [Phellinidium pouzarii]